MSIPRRWQAQPSTGLRLFGFRRSPGGFVGRPNRRDRCQERHGESRHQIATVTATFQIAKSQIATAIATAQRHPICNVIATSKSSPNRSCNRIISNRNGNRNSSNSTISTRRCVVATLVWTVGTFSCVSQPLGCMKSLKGASNICMNTCNVINFKITVGSE